MMRLMDYKRWLLDKPHLYFFVVFLTLFLMPGIWGQGSSAVLGGKVFDSQGKVIPKATVTVTSEETNVQWITVTNNEGNWRLEGLVQGHYRFNIAANGFKTLDHSAIELQIADQKFVDVVLEVGSTTEKITVEATTPLIDTTAGVSGTVITTEQLEELPSQTNSPVALAVMTPGVILGIPTGGVPHLWANTSESALTVDSSGQGTNQINYQIDGGTDTRGQTGIAYIPPMDAISEVRVTANAYDASIGRTAAGTIDMSMKSGTKDFHGVLYEMNQNNFLNANSYQNTSATPVPAVHMNEYGGTAGGPVWIPHFYNGRNKGTFFFFSWDGIRNSSPSKTGFMSLPTEQERKGDFSSSFVTQTVNKVTTVYPVQIFDPLSYDSTTGKRSLLYGTGTTIDPSKISPMAKAYLALMPLPNHPNDGTSTDSNDYLKNDPKIDKFASWALRVDHAWNNNHHTFADYRWNSWSEIDNDPFGPSNILSGQLQARENWGFTVDHTWVMTRNLVLDVRANATAINNMQSTTAAATNAADYKWSQALIDLQQFHGLPYLSGVGSGWDGGGMGSWQAPNYTDDRIWEINGKLIQTHGNHTFRYGVEYMDQQQANGSLSNGAGSFSFGTNWTDQNPDATAAAGQGSAVASFLMGMPTGGSIGNNATSFYTQPFMAYYFQDDWRATSKLTFNVGLRWDYQRPLLERHDRYWSRFEPWENISPVSQYAQQKYAGIIAAPGSNIGSKALAKWRTDVSDFNAYGAIHYAGINGTSRAVNDPYWKYFQPRLGFAYAINPKTVIRGGLGRFTEANFTTNDAHQDGYSSSTPFQPTLDNYHTINATIDNPFPNGEVAVTGNSLGTLTNVGGISSFIVPNGVRQYNDEASLHLQRQVKDWLFEVGGTLNLTRGITASYNIDGPKNLDAWKDMYGPQFDGTGRPLDTLSAATNVPNPFKGAPYITNGLQNNTTIQAWQLMRPNPLVGSMTETNYTGRTRYYSLQTRAERRFRNGFGILSNFTWGKQMDTTRYVTSYMVSMKLKRMLSTSDRRFLINVSPTYVLPFGRDQWIGKHAPAPLNAIIAGWELSGLYTYNSGSPLDFSATNNAYWDGTDPSLGSKKTKKEWFDTTKFFPFPSRSTPAASLAQYPSWTGIQGQPGYGWQPTSSSDATKNGVYNNYHLWSTNNTQTFGDVRNPANDNLDLGLRKMFDLHKAMKFQLRFDAFNAFNHPRYTSPDVTPGDQYFGYISGTLQPNTSNMSRAIQIAAKLYY
jgi:hypothetical protein